MWEQIAAVISGAIIGGGIGSALVNFFLDRWKSHLAAIGGWKAEALSKLYGPLVMQFDRTKRAYDRYQETDLYLETEVMRKSNLRIRDLLLEHGHLIPPELIPHAGKLIEHYDVWLAEYDRIRKPENPDLDTKFVFAGPKGFIFPVESEQKLRKYFEKLQSELYPGIYSVDVSRIRSRKPISE